MLGSVFGCIHWSRIFRAREAVAHEVNSEDVEVRVDSQNFYGMQLGMDRFHLSFLGEADVASQRKQPLLII